MVKFYFFTQNSIFKLSFFPDHGPLKETFGSSTAISREPVNKKKELTGQPHTLKTEKEIREVIEKRLGPKTPNSTLVTEGVVYYQIVNQSIVENGGDNFLNFDIEYKTDAGGRYADRLDFTVHYNPDAFGILSSSDITVNYQIPFNYSSYFIDAIDFPPVSSCSA